MGFHEPLSDIRNWDLLALRCKRAYWRKEFREHPVADPLWQASAASVLNDLTARIRKLESQRAGRVDDDRPRAKGRGNGRYYWPT